MISFVLSTLLFLVKWSLIALVLFMVFVTFINIIFGPSYRRATVPSRTDPKELTRRNLHFGLEHTELNDVSNWNGNGKFTSIFMGALSLFFPGN